VSSGISLSARRSIIRYTKINDNTITVGRYKVYFEFNVLFNAITKYNIVDNIITSQKNSGINKSLRAAFIVMYFHTICSFDIFHADLCPPDRGFGVAAGTTGGAIFTSFDVDRKLDARLCYSGKT